MSHYKNQQQRKHSKDHSVSPVQSVSYLRTASNAITARIANLPAFSMPIFVGCRQFLDRRSRGSHETVDGNDTLLLHPADSADHDMCFLPHRLLLRSPVSRSVPIPSPPLTFPLPSPLSLPDRPNDQPTDRPLSFPPPSRACDLCVRCASARVNEPPRFAVCRDARERPSLCIIPIRTRSKYEIINFNIVLILFYISITKSTMCDMTTASLHRTHLVYISSLGATIMPGFSLGMGASRAHRRHMDIW